MAELHSKKQILAAYRDIESYIEEGQCFLGKFPEYGGGCFLEVLIDIRDQLKRLADVMCSITTDDSWRPRVRVKIEPK